MTRFLWICLGGAFGTGCRYLVAVWAAATFGTALPVGTLLVNVAGSFFLGFLIQLGMSSELLSDTARLALTTGVMGGFTTYSTFNYETTSYLRHGQPALAALNVSVTLVAALAAGIIGAAAGRLVTGR